MNGAVNITVYGGTIFHNGLPIPHYWPAWRKAAFVSDGMPELPEQVRPELLNPRAQETFWYLRRACIQEAGFAD